MERSHTGTNIKEKKMPAKEKGSSQIVLKFPTWPYIPAQEVNRRKLGLNMNERNILVHSQIKKKKNYL